ncbi:hypothetical protein OU792_08950 [Algoriphagus sp. NF]|jgi:virulence-associated protein VagC|uniref:hypothetical protein n=1 Tax=Algoriphagus sp. NF TaxID=2992756 RepID=UPI001066239B|nr:hypothetical protein [Algoriphagus sp. NF]MDE0560109.1 hypothetical protein [Algoriphagus sp. NF]
MNLSFFSPVLLSLFLSISSIEAQQLIGKWQLVYFDGIDRIRNSAQFREADSATRANMEYRIKNRLESTIYQFTPGDSLRYTDMVNQTIVQRRAQIEIGEGDVLIIREGEMERKAKIVDFDENRLVLEPITKSGNSGKLVFERVVEKPKK